MMSRHSSVRDRQGVLPLETIASGRSWRSQIPDRRQRALLPAAASHCSSGVGERDQSRLGKRTGRSLAGDCAKRVAWEPGRAFAGRSGWAFSSVKRSRNARTGQKGRQNGARKSARKRRQSNMPDSARSAFTSPCSSSCASRLGDWRGLTSPRRARLSFSMS